MQDVGIRGIEGLGGGAEGLGVGAGAPDKYGIYQQDIPTPKPKKTPKEEEAAEVEADDNLAKAFGAMPGASIQTFTPDDNGKMSWWEQNWHDFSSFFKGLPQLVIMPAKGYAAIATELPGIVKDWYDLKYKYGAPDNTILDPTEAINRATGETFVNLWKVVTDGIRDDNGDITLGAAASYPFRRPFNAALDISSIISAGQLMPTKLAAMASRSAKAAQAAGDAAKAAKWTEMAKRAEAAAQVMGQAAKIDPLHLVAAGAGKGFEAINKVPLIDKWTTKVGLRMADMPILDKFLSTRLKATHDILRENEGLSKAIDRVPAARQEALRSMIRGIDNVDLTTLTPQELDVIQRNARLEKIVDQRMHGSNVKMQSGRYSRELKIGAKHKFVADSIRESAEKALPGLMQKIFGRTIKHADELSWEELETLSQLGLEEAKLTLARRNGTAFSKKELDYAEYMYDMHKQQFDAQKAFYPEVKDVDFDDLFSPHVKKEDLATGPLDKIKRLIEFEDVDFTARPGAQSTDVGLKFFAATNEIKDWRLAADISARERAQFLGMLAARQELLAKHGVLLRKAEDGSFEMPDGYAAIPEIYNNHIDHVAEIINKQFFDAVQKGLDGRRYGSLQEFIAAAEKSPEIQKALEKISDQLLLEAVDPANYKYAVPKSIANALAIETMPYTGFERTINKGMDYFRYIVLNWRPAYYFNNMVSNQVLGLLADTWVRYKRKGLIPGQPAETSSVGPAVEYASAAGALSSSKLVHRLNKAFDWATGVTDRNPRAHALDQTMRARLEDALQHKARLDQMSRLVGGDELDKVIEAMYKVEHDIAQLEGSLLRGAFNPDDIGKAATRSERARTQEMRALGKLRSPGHMKDVARRTLPEAYRWYEQDLNAARMQVQADQGNLRRYLVPSGEMADKFMPRMQAFEGATEDFWRMRGESVGPDAVSREFKNERLRRQLSQIQDLGEMLLAATKDGRMDDVRRLKGAISRLEKSAAELQQLEKVDLLRGPKYQFTEREGAALQRQNAMADRSYYKETKRAFTFEAAQRAAVRMAKDAFFMEKAAPVVREVRQGIGRIERFFGNYGKLTPFEKKYIRSIIPFWTFQKTMFKLAWSLPFTDPGKVWLIQQAGEMAMDAYDELDVPENIRGSFLVGAQPKGDDMLLTFLRAGAINPLDLMLKREYASVPGFTSFGNVPIPTILDPMQNPIFSVAVKSVGGVDTFGNPAPIEPGEIVDGRGVVSEWDGRQLKRKSNQRNFFETMTELTPQGSLMNDILASAGFDVINSGYKAYRLPDGTIYRPNYVARGLGRFLTGGQLEERGLRELQQRDKLSKIRAVKYLVKQAMMSADPEDRDIARQKAYQIIQSMRRKE
jgi:hypothetical protein